MKSGSPLFTPLDLPNGQQLKNRLIKSAVSDMLGDGRGNPTAAQQHLYARWAEGGVAASIVGEVQSGPGSPEASGNLILNDKSDDNAFRALAEAGGRAESALWLQLGHAGALTPPELGSPVGPSALNLPDLQARELSVAEIRKLPMAFARTAARAEQLGFAGVQIHAAHGFLLSQFLSPLFNRRTDAYGGPVRNRMRLLLEVVEAVRDAVCPGFTVALKLNSSDGLEGGLEETDALVITAELDGTGLDLIDISGGTYFPGAPASSDQPSSGPYFLEFAKAVRRLTDIPLMATGGFKLRQEAEAAIATGAVDVVGLARALILNPSLPHDWKQGKSDPAFPTFPRRIPGGVTAWYTLAIRAIAEQASAQPDTDIDASIDRLGTITKAQTKNWRRTFDLDERFTPPVQEKLKR